MSLLYKKNKFNKVTGFSLFALLGTALFLFSMNLWLEQRLLAETQARFQQDISLYGARLLQVVDTELATVNGLNTYLEIELQHSGELDVDELEKLSAGIYEDSTGLLNIAVAPAGIYQYVYPYEPNKSVIGYEPGVDERAHVRNDVFRAIATREVSLSLPIELIQGGQGVIARKAVYYEEEYWGLTAIVIDIPFLLEHAGISQGNSGMEMALKDQAGNVFFGSPDLFEDAYVMYEIPLEEGNWVLVGVPTTGWAAQYAETLQIFNALGFILAILFPASVYSVFSRQEQLESLVANRTHELSEANHQLQADILLREQAETELRVSEARANALLDAVPDLIFRINSVGIYLDYNADRERLYAPMDQIIGAHIGDFFDEALTAKVMGRIAETLETEQIVIFEYTLNYEDDTAQEYEARMVKSGADEVIITVKNITVRKGIELKTQKMNEELEKRVAERTATLDDTVKELESFSYSISHDLRAPLRAINGYSAFLENETEGQLNEIASDFLMKIKDASKHMDVLINDLLMLSRLGRQKFQPTSVQLDMLVKGIVQQLEMRGETLPAFQIDPCPIEMADAQLVRVLLSNLITNALKFTKNETVPKLHFGVKTETDEQVYFMQDNGVGFDMAYADKIFSPFQRLHSQDDFEGTGIGLAITKRIIDRHHGRIWVEAIEGEGTTIYFTLGDSRTS